MNNISLVGRATKDPEMKYTDGGTAMCKFSIAVDRGRKDRDGKKQSDFFNLVLFGKMAEIAGEYVSKGRQIAVIGAMQNNRYTNREGDERDWWEVQVDRLTLLAQPEGQRDGDDRGRDEREAPRGRGDSAPRRESNESRGRSNAAPPPAGKIPF